MGRARNNAPDESSLETLLDTVCNTLGVVVFIAMLLVVQINSARPTADQKPASQKDSAELVAQQQQLEETHRRIEQLQSAQAQQQQLTAKFANAESRRMLSQLRDQTRTQTQQLLEKQSTMSNIAVAQQAANQAAEKLTQQTQTLEELREQVTSIEQILKTEIEVRSKTAKFPEGRETTKDQFAFILKGGQLYRVYIPLPFKSFNSNEVQKVKSGTDEFIEPIAGKGLRINVKTPNTAEIVQRLNGYSKNDHVLRVFFWPDSFAEFQVLRDVLVQESFRYVPDPVPETVRIQTGGQSTPLFEQ